VLQVLIPQTVATSPVVEGVLTWAIPLVVFLAVLLWYFLLLRRHHPR
jgi:hypothetical protein